MKPASKPLPKLDLGPDVIGKLLPHRAPLALVDRVLGYRLAPTPEIRAAKFISTNEPVFRGHFPGFHLWPGVYTIEGLGQTCGLLTTIAALHDRWRRQRTDSSAGDSADDTSAEDFLAKLANLELGYRLHPGYRAQAAQDLHEFVGSETRPVQLMGAVDIKLRHPVFAGQTVEYAAILVHKHEGAIRCRVEATVGGTVVAEGKITGFTGQIDPRLLTAT